MKTIQILGAGCPRCNRLADATERAAIELGLNYRLEKITDIMRFADFGIMMLPAMAVDGEVRVSGRVPSHEQLKQMLQESRTP